MTSPSDNLAAQHAALKGEVVKLFQAIQEIKSELAEIKHPGSDADHFETVADQLNEIVHETEKASNTIMQAAEGITDIANKLQTSIKYKGALFMFQDMFGHANTIFEACAFNDITGQRITKITKVVNLIEGTLNSLVAVVGKEGLAALPLAETSPIKDDDVPMDGPAIGGGGVSQAEIDKLFN